MGSGWVEVGRGGVLFQIRASSPLPSFPLPLCVSKGASTLPSSTKRSPKTTRSSLRNGTEISMVRLFFASSSSPLLHLQGSETRRIAFLRLKTKSSPVFSSHLHSLKPPSLSLSLPLLWCFLDDKYLTSQDYLPQINKYKIKASQSIEDWEKQGWIRSQDPRGWCQVSFSFPLPSLYTNTPLSLVRNSRTSRT